MPRPTSKPELIAASEASFAKLLALIDAMPPEIREAPFAFGDRDRNVKDVLVHVHEWHRLLVAWVESNLAGEAIPFLPAGYTWTSYAPMNVSFRDQHAGTTLAEALALVAASRARVIEVIESFPDDVLFAKKHYPWTGSTSVGAYCVSATVAHDEWAMKKLRKHAKAQ